MFKKSYFKNIKKKLVGLCIALGLLTSAFAGISFNPNSQAMAYSKQSSSSFFSDANFTSYSGSSPLKPSQWSLISGEGNFNSETMVGAIFNSNSPTASYLKKYKVFNNPGLPTSDNSLSSGHNLYYSLALSAPYNAGGRFGYKPSSSSLNLAADSFYSIEITLKTITMADTTDSDGYDESYASSIDSMASIYLDGFTNLDNPELAKFEMIQSKFGKDVYNGWGTYVFYIATNQLESNNSLDLELWLGSKSQVSSGSVFFNNIKVYELDSNTFLNSTKEANNYTKVIDLRSQVNSTPITNANFNDTWTTGWDVVSLEALTSDVQDVNIVTFKDSDLYTKHKLTVTDNPATTNARTEGDNKVLFMANTENTYTAVESTDELTFKRQSYYKVSVWAWSHSSNSKAYAVLKNTTTDLEIENASIEIQTSNSVGEGKTNGWTEYSFYVYGNPFFDTTAKLQLALGSVDAEGSITGTTGYVYFDNITVQEINYSQFSSNSSNTNCTTFNYNNESSDDLVKNGTFNITQNENHSNTYPLTPASWSYTETTTGEFVTKAGVVNTHSTLFDASTIAVQGASVPTNPQSLPYASADSYNNVLMLGSRFVSTQEYKSVAFTLNADSYYKISLYVNAVKGGAGIKVSNSNGIILNKTNITSQGWTKFTTYVRTGASEDNVTISLILNNISTTTKYAFFDEVAVETSSESVYNSITANTNNTNEYTGEFVSKVDLLNYDFENESTTDNTANGFTVSESSENNFARIQNTAEEYSVHAHSGNNALVVFANDDTNGVNYLATTNRSYSLKSDSYYKISVFVKTLNIHNGGATIVISGDNLNKGFYDINSEGANTNVWTEFSFFISVKTDTNATLSLGLGNETTKSSGYAMFDDITIEKIADEDTFNTLTSSLNNATQLMTTVEASDDEATSTDENKDKDTFEGSFNWYIVTSLITALAIIIAVVGVMLRKVDIKHNKKIKTQYDRRRTLDISLDKKERIAKRQQEIYELERQLKEIEDEIAGIKRDVEVEKEEFTAKHNEEKSLIEQRKQAIVEEKEKALHERNEKIAKDKNAFTREEEEKFTSYIKKLEKKEQKENLELQKHDKAINNFKTTHSLRLQKSLARQEFIKAEIARIDAEIEAIAKEEAQIWEDYRLAKEDAKRRKAEYKAEQKELRNKKKATTKTNDSPEEEKKDDSNDEVEVITPDE